MRMNVQMQFAFSLGHLIGGFLKKAKRPQNAPGHPHRQADKHEDAQGAPQQGLVAHMNERRVDVGLGLLNDDGALQKRNRVRERDHRGVVVSDVLMQRA